MILVALGAAGCTDGSSAYTHFRMDTSYVGRPVGAALTSMGAPSSSYTAKDGTDVLSWERRQDRGEYPPAVCRETILAKNDIITAYDRAGNACGK